MESLGIPLTSQVPKAIQKETLGRLVFYDKKTKRYFSPDGDGHRANYAWKIFDADGNRNTAIFNDNKWEYISD